ncbi:hypothetical protein E2C01_041808 [Portunus trituberculatus]|uniref:Uncharacterized protein n=1 Tax=Portunus trituberculatus TaxID=210409 RepID=A0A5B7FSP2_PORTR|nr:hypothetical protein [Portunus trituberculatus]
MGGSVLLTPNSRRVYTRSRGVKAQGQQSIISSRGVQNGRLAQNRHGDRSRETRRLNLKPSRRQTSGTAE